MFQITTKDNTVQSRAVKTDSLCYVMTTNSASTASLFAATIPTSRAKIPITAAKAKLKSKIFYRLSMKKSTL